MLPNFSAVAQASTRQAGKTRLALSIAADQPDAVYRKSKGLPG